MTGRSAGRVTWRNVPRAQLEAAAIDYEILVIDDASSDATARDTTSRNFGVPIEWECTPERGTYSSSGAALRPSSRQGAPASGSRIASQ